jgi:putative endonuclease
MNWLLYIIRCSDETLYTGITTDLQRRFDQHKTGHGAKYFRGRQPDEVVYQEYGHTRSSASRREREIKTMERAEKLTLIASLRNDSAATGGPEAS